MTRSDALFFLKMFLILAVPFVLIQFIPYGRHHTNPPVLSEPDWANPQMRALVVRACYDCHSNQTNWRWYSNIAPASWIIQYDVDEGRKEVNFTEWDQQEQNTGWLVTVVYIDHMPPPDYQFVHPSVRYTPEERQIVVSGFQQMFPQQAAEQ